MAKRNRHERESRSLRSVRARVISTRRGERAATISNISNRGCCIRTGRTFAAGELVEILIPRLGSLSARIIWSRGRYSGAEFVRGSDRWLESNPEAAAETGARIEACASLAG